MKKIISLILSLIIFNAYAEKNEIYNNKENFIKIEFAKNKEERIKKNIFVNEGIVVNYYLYTKNKVLSFQIENFPKLISFYKRFFYEYNKFHRMDESLVFIKGIRYWKKLIYRVQLFPLEEGTITIDSIKVNVEILNPSSKFQQVIVSSESKKILVSRLINKNNIDIKIENEDYNLLGEHQIKAQIINSVKNLQEKHNFETGDFVKLQVIIEGEGTIELIDAKSIIDLPKDIELYDTNNNFSFGVDGISRREIIYTIIFKEIQNDYK
ncbi:MAG: BatD family protein, partial [Oligoflexia bacterium]|nr:BatD family protein [Oligoflexia bacterium]